MIPSVFISDATLDVQCARDNNNKFSKYNHPRFNSSIDNFSVDHT